MKKSIFENTSPWGKLFKMPMAIAGFVIIGLAFVVAVAGFLITPDQTPNANRQVIEITAREPGFSCLFLMVRKNENAVKRIFFAKMLFGQRDSCSFVPISSYVFKDTEIEVVLLPDPGDTARFTRSFGLADVVFPLQNGQKSFLDSLGQLHFTGIDGLAATADKENLCQLIAQNYVVEKTFLLGTDLFGRDMLSRLIIGTRVSLSVGFIAVLISLLIGLVMGLAAGYFGGRTDRAIMWVINVVWSVPTLLLVIAITMVLGKGFWQIFIAVGLTMWVDVARVVRGDLMGLKEKEFVEAARVLGFSDWRIMFRHILPNVLSPVIVTSASNFASAILVEAGLSFLGIGVQPPVPSWGTMIKEHYGYIIIDKAYLALTPGLAIMFVTLALVLIGNGLRDAFDPRMYRNQN